MMRRLRIHLATLVVILIALATAAPAAAQCNDGREGILADIAVGSNAIQWRMTVEHQAVTLVVSAPCGLVVERTYDKGEDPLFDLREIPADPDGTYHWQLRIDPFVDSGVAKEMAAAHAAGQDGRLLEYQIRQKGLLPEGPFGQSGSFEVIDGSIVDPKEEERSSSGKVRTAISDGAIGVRPAAATDCPFAKAAPAVQTARVASIAPAADGGGSAHPLAFAAETPRRMTEETVISGDLTVYNSLCVGFDCLASESYGSDTIRLKENNVRIHFDDTSTAAGFPANDWRLIANDQASGGASKFSIEDSTGSRTPFTIRAGASTNSIFVDSTGRVGFRTSTPVLDLHVSTSNTPAMRLEQTSAGGFSAQTWDLAGNEANFFVRDVTGGSRLPFRIRPGAPTSSIDISADGDVGFGTASPDASLHVLRSNASAQVFVEETSGTVATRTLLNLTNNGGAGFSLVNSNSGQEWRFDTGGADFNITLVGTGELAEIDTAGNMSIDGTLTTGGPTCGGGCDFVFDPAFPLESIEEHAEQMFANRYLPAVGPTGPEVPFNVTEKTGAVLNELEKAHIYIAQLNERLRDKEANLAELAAANSQLQQQQSVLAEQLQRLEVLVVAPATARVE
jgi:hypothetical protein